MNDLRNKPIGLIVAENLAAAKVFETHGMDFCCHGNQTLEAACAAHHIPVEQLETELSALNKKATAACPDVSAMSLPELTQHIIAVHHVYTKSVLPEIAMHLDAVVRAHGENHPELTDIRQLFTAVRDELELHLAKEEQSVFPYINALWDGTALPPSGFKKISQPIAALEEEHERAGKTFDLINERTQGYQPPADACNTYRLVLSELQELEKDLHIHIAKENYLLFPQAIKHENERNCNASSCHKR